MRQMVQSILDTAVLTASRRADNADIASAIIAALRRLRALADVEPGGAGAATFDDAVRALVLRRGLREAGRTGQAPAHVPIPAPGPQTAFASIVLEDAALTCLALRAFAPACALLVQTTAGLIDALVEVLGGIPDPAALLDRLQPRRGIGTAAWTPLPNLSLQ
ncbi:MAG TPA: hypothetical protein VF342_10235 [Alphaproteobacteria bacterium]